MPLLAFFLFAASALLLVLAYRAVAKRRQASQQGLASLSEKTVDSKHGISTIIRPIEDFKWQDTKPLQHRPFKPIYHITMAIKNSLPADLIIIDQEYKERIALRKSILAAHPDIVMGCVPEGAASVRELSSYLLGEYLPARYPTMFALEDGGRTFCNRVTGRSFPVAPSPNDDNILELLSILGETVEDDLFLLVQTPEGHHRLVAFVCCFPNGFNPREKLGMGLAEIHTPVPSYEKIGPSMERFFARFEVGQVVKRTNWSVTTHTELFSPGMNHVYEGQKVAENEEIDIETARVRVEFQALSRLPKTSSLLFLFKTYLYPVKQIKDEGLGLEFADAIEGLKRGNAPGMWVYKSGVRWGKSMCEYLRS